MTDRPEKLRTLHVNTERTWRGGEQQTLYLCRGLAERGHLVHLAAQPGSPMAARAREAGIATFEIRMRSEGDVAAIRRLALLMRRHKYDVVHSHTSHAHFIVWFAAYFGGRPRRIVSRRVDFSIYKHRFSLSKLKYIHGADRYITVSGAVRQVLIGDKVPPERIRVVHSGIDTGRFPNIKENPLKAAFGIRNGAPVVGNIAHMVDHKGQKYLIDAIPLILEKRPDARFFIVGDGPLMKRLSRRAQSLGLEGRLFLPGFKSNVAAFLDMFNVFVMPSVMEGLGTSVLDALACGKPVVATRTGGIPEMIEHGRTGLLVQPRDPGELANGVLDLICNPAKAARLGREGKKAVEKQFSVDAVIDKTLDVYYETLGKHRKPRRPA